MNLFAYLKSLFVKPAPPAAVPVYHYDAEAFRAQHTAYLEQKAAELPLKLERLESFYGDFNTFFYRLDFDEFVRKEFLPAWEPDNPHLQFLDHDHWATKHPFNFPGPFYTGESDTCGTGIWEAPNNVANDSDSCEYVFRQPQNYAAFLDILDAAATEVFDSYSANGNDYWTYATCMHWWRNRGDLIMALTRAETLAANDGQAQAYLEYLTGDAETDLRRYCYFLENGQYPADDNMTLPTL